MTRSIGWRAIVPLCFPFIFIAPAALADGALGTFGADARAKGMGKAQSALSRGVSAVFYNPANLPSVRNPTLTLQLTSVLPMLDAEFTTPSDENVFQARTPDAHSGWIFGATLAVPDFWDERIVLGFVAHTPMQTLTRADSPDPATPFFYRYDSYTERVEMEVALGVQLLDWLGVGGGARIGGGQDGVMQVAFDPLQQTMTRQELVAEQYGILVPKAGVSIGPFDWGWGRLRFGASYREKLAQVMTIFTHMAFEGLDAEADLPAIATTNFSPRKFQFGTAFTWVVPPADDAGWDWLAGDMHWAADVSHVQWSAAPSPFLSLRTSIRGEGAEAFGLAGNADVPGPGLSRVRPVDFSDTWNLHLGWEYELAERNLALRMGYQWRPTPVPDQVYGTNLMDASSHVGAFGVSGWLPVTYVAKRISLDFSWQSQILQRRTTEKVRADDPVGDWSIAGAVHEVSFGSTFHF